MKSNPFYKKNKGEIQILKISKLLFSEFKFSHIFITLKKVLVYNTFVCYNRKRIRGEVYG